MFVSPRITNRYRDVVVLFLIGEFPDPRKVPVALVKHLHDVTDIAGLPTLKNRQPRQLSDRSNQILQPPVSGFVRVVFLPLELLSRNLDFLEAVSPDRRNPCGKVKSGRLLLQVVSRDQSINATNLTTSSSSFVQSIGLGLSTLTLGFLGALI